MNRLQLIARLREGIDDRVEPYLIDTTRLTSYLSDAEEEACVRARLIRDAETRDVCRVRVRPGERNSALHPVVTHVREARLEASDTPLEHADTVELERLRRDWQKDTETDPTHWLTDHHSGAITFYPKPAGEVAFVVNLVVNRLPLVRLEDLSDTDCPEIPLVHHAALVDWAIHLALSSPDGDTYDPNRAADAAERFALNFGRRPTADALRRESERQALPLVNGDWF